jgi:hypothetical protein
VTRLSTVDGEKLATQACTADDYVANTNRYSLFEMLFSRMAADQHIIFYSLTCMNCCVIINRKVTGTNIANLFIE